MKLKVIWISLTVLCVLVVSSCQQKTASQDTLVFNRYNMTTLKVSTSADIIAAIQTEGELVTKGENAVAAWGQAKKETIIWFNAIAFDDETSKAVRKYAFSANPKGDGIFSGRVHTMRFDGELVINIDILNEPHANDNARKIAILKSVLSNFSSDLQPLIGDGKVLNNATLMAKQLLKALVYDLDASPGLAVNLQNYSGMDFDHMILGKGKVRMVIVDGVVKIKAMTGSAVKDFNRKLNILSM